MGIMGRLPKLKTVDRSSSTSVLIFSFFNLVLGAGLYMGFAETKEFFIINELLTYQIWGIGFFLVGVLQLFFYLINRWDGIRMFFLAGFSLKLFWLIALAYRQVMHVDSNVFLLCMFTSLAALQLNAFIHFPRKKEVLSWTRRRL